MFLEGRLTLWAYMYSIQYIHVKLTMLEKRRGSVHCTASIEGVELIERKFLSIYLSIVAGCKYLLWREELIERKFLFLSLY